MNRNSNTSGSSYFNPLVLRHLSYCSILPKILASASHEMLQPINIIKISAGGILGQMKKGKEFFPEMLKEDLETINGQADRVAQIIRELHSISKEEPEPSVVLGDVNSAIEQSLSICRRQFRTHGIETALDLEPELPPVQAQICSLKFVFLSLINNSLEALVRRDEEQEGSEQQKQLQIKTFGENGKVIIQVIDNGVGIPSKLEGKLFTPFTMPDIDRPCLGLFLCSLILGQTGDTIYNTSPRNPTTFQITLQPAS